MTFWSILVLWFFFSLILLIALHFGHWNWSHGFVMQTKLVTNNQWIQIHSYFLHRKREFTPFQRQRNKIVKNNLGAFKYWIEQTFRYTYRHWKSLKPFWLYLCYCGKFLSRTKKIGSISRKCYDFCFIEIVHLASEHFIIIVTLCLFYSNSFRKRIFSSYVWSSSARNDWIK